MFLEIFQIIKPNLDILINLTLFVVKFYRLLCYTTYTFDIFPVVNPYNWPLSFINALTRPYFRKIKKFFKTVYLGGIIRFDISPIIGFLFLEVLYRNLLLLQFIYLKNFTSL
jgi:uncharacterized protein YggT (Ycf19 family)